MILCCKIVEKSCDILYIFRNIVAYTYNAVRNLRCCSNHKSSQKQYRHNIRTKNGKCSFVFQFAEESSFKPVHRCMKQKCQNKCNNKRRNYTIQVGQYALDHCKVGYGQIQQHCRADCYDVADCRLCKIVLYIIMHILLPHIII